MPELRVSTNAADLIADFGRMQYRQLPFALRLALQRTAEEARDAVRQRIFQRGFRFRDANAVNYLANAIVIDRPIKSASDPSARYTYTLSAVSKAGRSRSRSLLPWLEEGGSRTSPRRIGPYGSAVAVPLRSSPMERIPRNLFPAQTGIGGTTYTIPQRPARGRQRGARGQVIGSVGISGRMQGKRGTFLIPSQTRPNENVIFQRVGSGRRDLRPLFLVRPSVQVAGRQFFFPVAQRTVRERFPINFQGAMRAALFSGEIGRNRGVRVRYMRGMVQPSRPW